MSWNKWVEEEEVSLMHSLITLGKVKDYILESQKAIEGIKSFDLLPKETQVLLTAIYKTLTKIDERIVNTTKVQKPTLDLLVKFDEMMTSLLANERPHPLDTTEPP